MLTLLKKQPRLVSFFDQFITHNGMRGDIIMAPDLKSSGVTFIESGYVRIFGVSSKGKELSLLLLGPGSFFGYNLASEKFSNRFYYEVFQDVKYRVAPRDEFEKFLQRDGAVQLEVMKYYATLILSLMDSLSNTMESASERVLRTLFNIITYSFSELLLKSKVEIPIPLTQHDIALFCGLTRENTALQLNLLKKKNIIEIHRPYILIKDVNMFHNYLKEVGS